MDSFSLEFLKKLLSNEYSNNYVYNILDGYNVNRKTTIRVNTLISTFEEVIQFLDKNNISYSAVNDIPNAIIINDSYDVTKTNLYENGAIYLQSLSSMLPPLILNPKEDAHILDMCAAPGSKTTQLAALTNNKACITACEFDKIRAERLKYNLNKLGTSRVTVLVKDSRNLDEFFRFDTIMLDAPCSGSGTVLLNEESKQVFNQKVIDKCQKRQISLLKKGLSMLNKNGVLVYSTCSILKEENEQVLKACLNGNFELIPIDRSQYDLPYLPSLENTITIAPTELYEGFFVVKIRRIKFTLYYKQNITKLC